MNLDVLVTLDLDPGQAPCHSIECLYHLHASYSKRVAYSVHYLPPYRKTVTDPVAPVFHQLACLQRGQKSELMISQLEVRNDYRCIKK
jgi:hypothetical protein